MIRIQNIYYMLAYAFQVLNEQGYKNIAAEEFNNTAELFAAILSQGIRTQIKRGFEKNYIPHQNALTVLRGRIDISESIKNESFLKSQMVCSYDDFSVNSTKNRIIKSTLNVLLKSDISKTRKKELRALLVFFQEVDLIDLHAVNWHIQYNKNNQTYRMLISICYLVVKGLLQTQSNGTTKLMDFLDEQRMSHLYEKFILNYYRKKFPQLSVESPQIPWITDDTFHEMLPVMQTDITIEYQRRILIIDAKYYSSSTQVQYDVHSIHSGNLYQIFTYVKNKEAGMINIPHKVSGMLLYAKTDELVQPDQVYRMSGNKISVKTLDLDQDFSQISSQLNQIIRDHFEIDN